VPREGLSAFTEAARGNTKIAKEATQQLMAALTTPSTAKSTMLGQKGKKVLVVASTSILSTTAGVETCATIEKATELYTMDTV
jgi:hypothetical protein